MKAAVIETTGPPDVIKFAEIDPPAAIAGYVLVKVQAASVNPIDTYIRSGKYRVVMPSPFVIGRDMVGTVVEVGERVDGFKTGDRVWCNNQGYAGRQGTFSEFVSVKQELLYHLAEDVCPINAVASVHSALTAVVALDLKARLQSGEWIFINGGSGNVGTCVMQIAKARGARIAVTAGSDSKTDHCRKCGADAVINYKTDDLKAALLKLAPQGVDIFFDLSGKPDLELAVSASARRGRILLASGLEHTSRINVGDFYTRNCTIYGFTVTDLSEQELSQCAQIINTELKAGTIQTEIAQRFSLSRAMQAHEYFEKNKPSGKIIIDIDG